MKGIGDEPIFIVNKSRIIKQKMFQNYKALKKNLQENQMLKEIRINKKEEKIQKLKKKRIML